MNQRLTETKRRFLSILFIAICLSAGGYSLHAQSGGGFQITEAAVAAGAASMSGSNFEIDATLGQPAAGESVGAGLFAITSGFWNFTSLAPTAAGVTISGRIMTADGGGINNARLFLQTQTGEIFLARSASFGYYIFENIEAGQTVFITVEHKLFTFEPRSVMVIDSISDLDFQPIENLN